MKLRETLERHEGRRSKPYIDPSGHVSIGVGRNLTDVGLRDDEIDRLLTNDIIKASIDVATKLPWSVQLDQDCRDVLINMCFNMGIGKLLEFRNFLDALRVGAYPEAAKYMLNSVWAGQVGGRARELSAIIGRKVDNGAVQSPAQVHADAPQLRQCAAGAVE
jgi:lysozyme